jgi:hypothetical protein
VREYPDQSIVNQPADNTPADRPAEARGTCLCGRVAFAVQPPFAKFVICHCGRCRKANGSSQAVHAAVLPSDFRWLQGE